MTLNAKNLPSKGGNFTEQESLEVGNYPARLAQVVNLGLQPQRPYKGEEKPPAIKLLTTYELSDEFMKDENGEELKDKPRFLTEEFTFNPLSSKLATSTKRYKSLDPDGVLEGEWDKLLGTPAMITVTSNEGKGQYEGRVFNNISNVAPMRKKDADKLEPMVNEPVVFDFFTPDLEVFNSLPEWIQEKIKGCLEFKGSQLESLLNGGSDYVPESASPDVGDGSDVPW